MNPQTNLEINGDLKQLSFAASLAVCHREKLSGSFRISSELSKAIIYLNDGEVIFAVSNQKEFKLFHKLLQTRQITETDLLKIPDYANDVALAQHLLKSGTLTKSQIEEAFVELVEKNLRNILQWQTGEWFFSPLVRVKTGVGVKIDVFKILLEFAREENLKQIAERFEHYGNLFSLKKGCLCFSQVSPEQGFLLSRFDNEGPITLSDLSLLTGFPENEIIKNLYVLEIEGFITSTQNGAEIFSEEYLQNIKSARLRIKGSGSTAKSNGNENDLKAEEPADGAESTIKTEPESQFPLEEYLHRVETAKHFYETLGIKIEADSATIKKTYFTLAQNFHPDKFHHSQDEILQQRIQKAFVEIAKAYEVLKSEEKKSVYDSQVKEFQKNNFTDEAMKFDDGNTAKLSAEDFERGISMIVKGSYQEAIALLTQAVRFEPNNARYRAYLGKALASDRLRKFQAEQELLNAVRLNPQKSEYRLMLAEFYVNYNLPKRAEGELHRLLNLYPQNYEAQKMLGDLKKDLR